MLDFKRLRVDVGMTQSAVADKLGVTLRTYQRMEKDPEALSQKDLQKIATIFGVKKVKDESYSDGLSEKERQIISSLRKLPEDKQDIYFHRILADALEYETMTNPLGGSLSGIGGKSQKTS